MEGLPFEGQQGARLRTALLVTVILLAVFLAVEAIGGIMGWRYIGTGVAATNTISVSGHGESLGVPDIATFTFSVVSDKTTVADAQADATAKANAITDYLTSAGVSKNDIQTSNYSIEPQYDYQTQVCPQAAVTSGAASAPVYCGGGNQVLKGYEVSQSTTIKVRDTSKAGDLLAGVGSKGATQVSGLTFTFDNPDSIQTDARNKAIADAKTKADALAKQLGVTLVRVTSFNENTGGTGPRPMVYSMASGAADTKAVAPEISTGQNDVTDDVTITYEIK
ncbi:MAG TPA: SIMPL domain-containing protein [Candidatus Paceibacterota bacterium]|nr:SIMPL domain-containing protein [Candidatus Paceibacterota bacterium]